MILLTWDMHEFHPLEVLLEPMDLFEVCRHVAVLWHVALVGEVDEELEVPLDEEVLDAECDCGPEASEEPSYSAMLLETLSSSLKHSCTT